MSITRQEAIEELKADVAMYDNEICRLDLFKDDGDGRLIQALEMGIEAIKKQLPMKPVAVTYTTEIRGHCPRCCTSITRSMYCPTCGQAIDWIGVE